MIMPNETNIMILVLEGIPFHSPLNNPQSMAMTIVKAIKIPQAANVYCPNILLPAPKKINCRYQSDPASAVIAIFLKLMATL